MKNHEITLLTSEQAGELLAPIMGVVLGLSQERAQYWIGRKRKLAAKIKKALIEVDDYRESLNDWQSFYKKHFNLVRDFSGLVIPEKKEGFDRLIVVAKGMTPERIFSKIKSLMPAWKYRDNLDEIVSDRKTDKDYCIWVRDQQEADEELKNKSTNDLKEENIPGITLEERLLFELKYFEETGNHLDVQNVTLCAGSRDPDGGVPGVRWHGDGVGVYGYNPDRANDRLRSRVAVS